ncbi:MAG: hypothetical protein HY587_07975 [Candidatus Omnitrophica bacterium]|nr:hypothetical protein [Candidatus Omnitrophota bacterium]
MLRRQAALQTIEHTAQFVVLVLMAAVILFRLISWISAEHLTFIEVQRVSGVF